MTFVSVNGARLFVREAGSGPPVLLIHGAGPDSRGWGQTFDDLARDHRVVAYDRRGFGESRDEPLVGWHGHAEDAAALVSDSFDGPAAVIGWSGGGLVAFDLAVNHPDLVSALVVAEPALYGKRHVTPSLAVAFLRALAQRALGRERAATETILRWIMAEPGGQCTLDRDDYPQERREMLLGNARGLWNDFGSGDGSHIPRDRLEAIACPITWIVGEDSRKWFLKAADGGRKLFPQMDLRVVRGSNHAFTFHRPAEFAELIREAVATSRA